MGGVWIILLYNDIHLKGITQLYFSCIFTYFLLIKYRKNTPLSKFGSLISNQSFTIYILHQFIINFLLLVINFNEKKMDSIFYHSINAFISTPSVHR